MFTIKINKKTKKFSEVISGIDLLQEIDQSLRSKCIAIKINDKIQDLLTKINYDCEATFILSSSTESLDIIRRHAAYILAQAVKILFPKAMIVRGHTMNNGFYYDFGNVESFKETNLKIIETKMQEIIDKKLSINKKTISKQEAINLFHSQGEKYKVKIINSLGEEEKVSIYSQEKFLDLYEGVHLAHTAFVKVFKLTKVSGVYWDENNHHEALQRIYGTAWFDKKDLDQHLITLGEIYKRDHRKIGKQSHLFHLQEEAQGSVFWHPKGWDLYQRLITFIRNKQKNNGYQEINTPEIMNKKLWESSGHWEKFRVNMYTVNTINQEMNHAIRPMNCPGSVQIYNQGIKSYRDLPIRFSEFGKVHRFEPSGSLYGLMRTRAFTQDDAHIFCTHEQITNECIKVCTLIKEIYQEFGFKDIKVKFSDRPKIRIGSDKIWDKSEAALINAITQEQIPYTLNQGEGSFYGPKLEFVLKDAIERDWQLGTLQVDFNLPERLNALYTEKDGKQYRPVILHRALFGSIERFIGILLEHYSGNLPIWLAPIQVVIISVTDVILTYAQHVCNILKKNCIRYITDFDNEKISYKIRKYSIEKIPIIVILGKKEEDNRLVSIRKLGNKDQETLELSHFVDIMINNIQQRKR